MNNTYPHWGKFPESKNKISDFYYLSTTLNDKIIPNISGEDLSAIQDYPSIYIYISRNEDNKTDNNLYYYIGQTINIYKRTKQHSNKADSKKSVYEKRFEKFKYGRYFVFYGKKIAQNLDYIEQSLILFFIQEFNFLNFVDLNKDDQYLNFMLANKKLGNESIKLHELRIQLDKNIINPMIKILHKENVFPYKYKKIDVSKIRSSLFMDTPFFTLTKVQESIINNIVSHMHKKNNNLFIDFIKGDPGTGKSVLLLNLIAKLKNKNNNLKIAVYLRNNQRQIFTKSLKSFGLNPSKNNIDVCTLNNIIKNQHYDYIIVDEAQRTTKRIDRKDFSAGAKWDTDFLNENNYKNTIQAISLKTNNLVIAYDSNQALRATDLCNVKEIIQLLNLKECQYKEHNLPYQLRILNSKDEKFANAYIFLLKYALDLNKTQTNKDSLKKKTKVFAKNNKIYNYLKFAESFEDLEKYIKNKKEIYPHKGSGILTGFSLKRNQMKQKYGHQIGYIEKIEEWIYSNEIPHSLATVYDVLGKDLDFTGIYIGNDIILDKTQNKIISDVKNFYDSGAKRGTDNCEEYIRNSYYVLLTRAIFGCIIYIENIELRNYLKSIFSYTD